VFDTLLRGGTVADGTGSAPARADVGVRDGRIAAVGDLTGAAAGTELDATGCYVLPGFIDTHVHADAGVWDADVAGAMLLQGITTAVVGQDGISFAPATAQTAAYIGEYFAAVNGSHPLLPQGPASVADLLDAYRDGSRLNVAYLVPHANIRLDALGLANRPPDNAELAAMTTAVERAMSEGAVGLSTGLEYLPGEYARTSELVALLAPLRSGGLYVSHMRGYELDAKCGMDEVAAIHAGSGVPVHVSHYHGPAPLLAQLIAEALDGGADVSFDSYPYLRGSSLLAMVAVPYPLQAGGPLECVTQLSDPRVRAELRREWTPRIAEVLGAATLSRIGSGDHRWAEGLTVVEAAERAETELTDFLCDLLAASRMEVGCVFATGRNSEEDLRALMRLPQHMACSDGIYVGSRPHPRGWGSFARYLRRYTVELSDYSWADAAVHLSARAAERFGLADRGRIAAGRAADVAVIDPASIADNATYVNPTQTATGTRHVLVNGVAVVVDGKLGTAPAGQVLSR
jgi:N-acyl-D-amino-acid deacylase